MEQRLMNSWKMTVNEKKFIEIALASDIRIDGRRPFDYRRLNIKFGREDASSEVQLGHTHVMGYVTSQLVQPYRDRPNEGTLSIYTEFSPMADPSFEVGRPGESAIELGRIIDRGLRESRAVDMESLCIVAGKFVWAIRVDLHILDNGGNLIDAANIAALTALLTFQRPECTVGGEDGQEVIIHPPEVREPLPLIVHHLPIAVSFAFLSEGNIMVIDPTYSEEAIMGGRMTATVNSNGDVCAVQKAGGVGVMSSVIMQCLRIASVKAADITSKIKNAVDAYNTERALKKVKRQSTLTAVEVDPPNVCMKKYQVDEILKHHADRVEDKPKRSFSSGANIVADSSSSQQIGMGSKGEDVKSSFGGPSNWDPYSKGIPSNLIRNVLTSPGLSTVSKEHEVSNTVQQIEANPEEAIVNPNAVNSVPIESGVSHKLNSPKSLRDAVKPKSRRKNKASSNSSVN